VTHCDECGYVAGIAPEHRQGCSHREYQRGRDLLHSTPSWVEALERVYGPEHAARMLERYPLGSRLPLTRTEVEADDLRWQQECMHGQGSGPDEDGLFRCGSCGGFVTLDGVLA